VSVIPLSNFLSDLPSLAIATDNVDADQVRKPRHWDIGFVRRFMVTFASLLLVAGATAQVFQTGWFVESLVTELAIVLVVRTRKAFWLSRPSALLSWPMLAIGLFAIAIPYLSGATSRLPAMPV
jgi:P-type Mg2+ transporter